MKYKYHKYFFDHLRAWVYYRYQPNGMREYYSLYERRWLQASPYDPSRETRATPVTELEVFTEVL